MKVTYLEPKDLERPKRVSKVDLSPYRAILENVPVGSGFEINLEEGETSRALKRRFTTAAGQMGKKIVYRTPKEGDFRIVVKEQVAAAE